MSGVGGHVRGLADRLDKLDRFASLGEQLDLAKVLEEFTIEVPISKTDDEQMLAFGWANVAIRKDGEVIEDRQGDIVDDIEEMEKTAYQYVVNSRDAGQEHARTGVATLIESMVFTPEKLERMGIAKGAVPLGWWTGYQVQDQETWEGIKDGTYPMMSIHGLGKRTPM